MAADAVVSAVLEKLTSGVLDEIEKEVRRVVNVRREVKKLKSTFQAIEAILEDAERQQLDKRKARVRDWLHKLKDVSYDIDNALDEWSTVILKSKLESKPKVCSFFPSPSYCFNRWKLLLKTAHKIQNLNGRLDDIANERERYGFQVLNSEKPKRDETTSFINIAEVMGRVEDEERIVSMLLNEGRAEEIGLELQMISIVGVGGIGKTTLAKLAFDKVKPHFEKKIWLCVSDAFDEMKIAKDILKSVIGDTDKDDIEKLDKLEDVMQKLKTSIEGKKFLLVLDDVWTEEYGKWDQLKHVLLSNGSQGSKILVTTRKEKVAKRMGCKLFEVRQLSEEESWSLFSYIAFFGRSNDDCRGLEDIGREIAKKCRGLPLALKTLGGVMLCKKTREDWRRVLESEVWELEEAEEGLFHPLMFSYFDLPSHLRQCFSYCAIFPKDYVIEKKKLIGLWMAQGFLNGTRDMEMAGEDFFNDLSMHFFFQDFEVDENGDIIKCKMHDMVHDFAIFLTRGECLTMESNSSIQSFNGRPRHLFLTMHKGDSTAIPTCIYNAESLHTLLIESEIWNWNSISHMELLKLFDKLKCLRMLQCSKLTIEQYPTQIGKLIHLRHLDLSDNSQLKELPETVCDLYNLLILDITECNRLKRLPGRMGDLVNLFHLRNGGTDALHYMPKGMEKLTGLRTLNKFVVTDEGAALSDLGNLNHLRGTLEITGLGMVRDVKEAEKVQLQSKKGLTSLSLRFDANGLLMSQVNESLSLLLEALKPPSDLVALSLYGHESPLACISPTWMVSLTKLKKLEIREFANVEQLSLVGELLSLESVNVACMKKVKKVGVEFLGREMSLSASSSSVVAFPNLKRLNFDQMGEWEEWDCGSRGEVMPRLSCLVIRNCPKLTKLPDYFLQNTSLQDLMLDHLSNAFISNLFRDDCRPHIFRISNMDVEGEKEIVGHINPIVSASPSWITPLTNLKKIKIVNSNVEHLPPLGKLPSLESLSVRFMKKVKKVGVEFLGIEMSLSPPSSSIVAFPNLKSLAFYDMDEWEEWEEWEEWDYGSRGEIMPRLSSLNIGNCWKLKRLPDYILQNTTLQELGISNLLDAFISNLFKDDCRPHIPRISNMDVEGEKEIVGHTNPIVWAGPSWIPPLSNLKHVKMYRSHMEHLPPLGKLPSLESLYLNKFWRVKKVGVEFLGIETSLFPSSSSVVAFPNLKSLQFSVMQGWEEWDYESRGEEGFTIMPRLSSLTIDVCSSLKMLPDYILQNTTLQSLEIDGGPIILKCCKEDYQPFISRIPHCKLSLASTSYLFRTASFS